MELTTEDRLIALENELNTIEDELQTLRAEYNDLYNDNQKTITMLIQCKEVVKSMTAFIDAVVEELN